jgi:subtilisin family serine protease
LGNIRFDLMDVLEERDQERSAAQGNPEAEAAANRPILVEVVFRGSVDPLLTAGFKIRSFFDGYGGADLTPDEVRSLSELTDVLEIRLPARSLPLLDKSVPQIKASTAWGLGASPMAKGSGAIIGIIDDGIDVRHQAFKDSAGNTRILRLWDQTFSIHTTSFWPVPAYYDRDGKPLSDIPTDDTGAPVTTARTAKAVGSHFDYGVEFNEAQINKALQSPPSPFPAALGGASGRADHGTRTTGIAAGQPGTSIFSGVAPESGLIFVRTDLSDTGVQEAANYIVEAAKIVAPGRPVVINCSFGGHTAPHNGFAGAAMAFDEIMKNNPKVLIVLAAGNERDENMHAAERLILSDPATTVQLRVNKSTDKIIIFGSYNASAYIKCGLIPPPNVPVSSTKGNWYISIQDDPFQGETSTRTGSKPKFKAKLAGLTAIPGDPDAHFTIEIENAGGVPVGTWSLQFASEAFADGNLHLWLYCSTRGKDVAEFLPPQVDASNRPSMQDLSIRTKADMRRPDRWIRGTVSATGAAGRPVTVGAYDAESSMLLSSDFSCQGPCPKGLGAGLYSASSIPKPDIAAPGERIDAPTTTAPFFKYSIPYYSPDDGTSFSAPHVAGVAALIWSQKPSLANSDVKDILMKKARGGAALQDYRLAKWIAGEGINPGNPGTEKELWGAGMLDAEESVKEARNRP